MKSQFPYLVDLSITNQCPLIKICSVGDSCYASPVHKTDELTSWDYFKDVADAMYNSNVLEVAIGGYSEPTTATMYSQHTINSLRKDPDFKGYISKYDFGEVCLYLKKRYFKVGWTTRNYNLDKLPFLATVLQNTDSIAFSATTLDDLLQVNECIRRVNALNLEKRIGRWSIKPTVQVILEIMPFDEFKRFIDECCNKYRLPVTILGYKDFGNGKNKKPFTYTSEWVDFMVSMDLSDGFGVDSQIVKDWGDDLIERGVKNYRLVSKEGSQTCFVDLQKQVMKPSSFTDASYELSDPKDFLKTFQKF